MGTWKKWLLMLLIAPMALAVRADSGSGSGIGGEAVAAGAGKVEGILHGYVTDAVTKKPLQGVTVSATIAGSNNSKETKEVTTDADGYFRFVQLPAQQITVLFDKKGYQSAKRPNVTVKEKTAVKLSIDILPEDDGSDSDNSEYPILKMLQAAK